jgi:Uncharacterized protein related to capsule biosynthesis enzymes
MKIDLINYTKAYVWLWLPRHADPVYVGKISPQENIYTFKYDREYLNNPDAIALSPFELPLEQKSFVPEGLNNIASCLRDAAPDAWGRRVINNELNVLETTELVYMLLSGSNRVGALDFQFSNKEYLSRNIENIQLSQLMQAATYVDENKQLPKELENIILHGTSIGGARPKAFIDFPKNKGFIAKFSSTSDYYNVIKAEFVGMRLANLAKLNVANVKLHKVMKKDVLLIERFDRVFIDGAVYKKQMLSGLSLLKLNEMEARYASYPDFAEVIRMHFYNPKKDLPELYKRLAFNILIGNNDDHARNHSAFWDGKNLELTPAYDLCPQPRIGRQSTQAMAINGIDGNSSRLVNILTIADKFQLSNSEAKSINEDLIQSIRDNWEQVCDEGNLTKLEQSQLWGKSIFNPFVFE